jgi:hypothetical protein
MSAGSIRKEVSAKLLNSIERGARNEIREAARKVFELAQVSQCLVLDRKGVTALVRGFESGIGRKLSSYERREYRSQVKQFFEGLSKPFPEIPEKKHFEDILARHNLFLGNNIHYLGVSFKTIKNLYHGFNEDFIESKKTLRGSEYSRDSASKTTQFDHGAQGTAVTALGGASAAVSVALDRGMNLDTLEKVAGANLEAIIDARFKELSKGQKAKLHERLFDLVINWDQVVDPKGGVRAGVGIVVSPRLAKENLARSGIEKKEANAIIDAIDAAVQDINWIEVEGSSNLRQKMQKKAIIEVTDNLTKLGKKYKSSKVTVKLDQEIKKAKLKTQNKVKDSTKPSGGVSVKPYSKSRGKLAGSVGAASKGTRRQKSNVNVVRLLGVLNSQLPKVVAKNMGSPRLNYRTGRFAGSVRATDIAITAKGHPSIGYTYQRDPYEVFESSSGSKFSSKERDPRSLIDVSIREIATQQAIGRLFTRRV